MFKLQNNGYRTGYYAAAPTMYGGFKMLGKTSSRSRYGGSGSRTITKRRKRNSGKYGLKTAIRSLESALHLATPGTGSNYFAATHNTVYSQNCTYNITQGTAQSNRQGDSVFLCALKFSGFHEGPVALQDGLVFRVLVFYADPFSGSAVFNSSTIGTGDLFIATNQYTSTGIIDPKKVYVVYDETIEVQPSVTNTYTGTNFNGSVQLNKGVNYFPGTNEVNPRQLYITVIPSIANGTTGVTSCGKFAISTDLIFKNSK